MVWFKEAKIEDLVKDSYKFIQKIDVVAAVIFTVIDVEGESESKQQQPCYFCYDHILDTGWSSCGDIISFLKTIVECYHMQCSLSPMRPAFSIIPTTEIYFQSSLLIGFDIMHKIPSQAPEYLQPHVSYILSKASSSSTQLKVLSHWSKITNFMFLHFTTSIECISKILDAWRKHLEQKKPSDLSSSLNARYCKLWFESFGFFSILLSKTKEKEMYFLTSDMS